MNKLVVNRKIVIECCMSSWAGWYDTSDIMLSITKKKYYTRTITINKNKFKHNGEIKK